MENKIIKSVTLGQAKANLRIVPDNKEESYTIRCRTTGWVLTLDRHANNLELADEDMMFFLEKIKDWPGKKQLGN
jgi:hypothetical protein